MGPHTIVVVGLLIAGVTPKPAASLKGKIAGAPFVARSALLFPTADPKSLERILQVSDQPLTCDNQAAAPKGTKVVLFSVSPWEPGKAKASFLSVETRGKGFVGGIFTDDDKGSITVDGPAPAPGASANLTLGVPPMEGLDSDQVISLSGTVVATACAKPLTVSVSK